MSNAAREVYDDERKTRIAESIYKKFCRKEKKPEFLVSVALYGFFHDGGDISIDDLVLAMNQQSNSIYHVSRDLIKAYIDYMVMNGTLIATSEGKFYLFDNPRGVWG